MAKMVFAGKINTDILAALRNRGLKRLVFREWTATSYTPDEGRQKKS